MKILQISNNKIMEEEKNITRGRTFKLSLIFFGILCIIGLITFLVESVFLSQIIISVATGSVFIGVLLTVLSVIIVVMTSNFLLSLFKIYVYKNMFTNYEEKRKMGIEKIILYSFLLSIMSFGFNLFMMILGSYVTNEIVLFLISILTIILLIFLSLTYAHTVFYIFDNPNKSTIQAMRESRKRMAGNRGSLFGLFLRYIFIPVLVLICIYFLAMMIVSTGNLKMPIGFLNFLYVIFITILIINNIWIFLRSTRFFIGEVIYHIKIKELNEEDFSKEEKKGIDEELLQMGIYSKKYMDK